MVHVPLMFLSEWREFPSAPCIAGKKLDESSYLDVVENARRLTCFPLASVTRKTCNSAHEQTPLSNDPIDYVLRHWEVVGLRTYRTLSDIYLFNLNSLKMESSLVFLTKH